MRYIWILSFILLYNCKSQKAMDIQGHRGCRGLHPENSLPAFKKALELKVHTLELDLAISKDHKVVVSHEPFMNHEIALDLFGNEITPNLEKSFNLYQMPYDSIKLYDCGSKKHPRFPFQKNEKVYKPLLKEIIDLAERESENTIFYNIEIKSMPEYDGIYSPSVKAFVKLVLDIVETKGISERTIMQSFDMRALEETKLQNPQLQTALLVDENEFIDTKLQTLSYKPEIISPYFKLLDKETVLKLQNDGFKIIPWTVNEIDDINLMYDLNVDGIISDFPDRIIQLNINKK
ncbi:glycerophosphodiester phosphodiesterase family protein [Psychroserpens damuponensis]|uniref:glycerophosphodiester phosphodiesterase family protein n=1 Tax=Psychroserpens damuponensis TaxID=943936 RepID=UPI00059013DE|nr:glycerophosphodiester phosphodiesterase family protein [Psychroserpens damuponensis]